MLLYKKNEKDNYKQDNLEFFELLATGFWHNLLVELEMYWHEVKGEELSSKM